MKKIYINPKTPKWMDSKDLNARSKTHMKKWFNRAYIQTQEFVETIHDRKSWHEHWGEDGVRYDVRMLDGGAWDRTTSHGSFATLAEAIAKCNDVMKR